MANDIEKAKTQLIIFLAGPSINPGEEPADGLIAHKARFNLFNKIEDQGHTCTLGEHNGLIEIYKDHCKNLANLAISEMTHVIETSDAVVILPSSPGSFCELGMFGHSDSTCSKMLILMDRNHEENSGYPFLWPAAMAKNYGADIRHVDYENHEIIWEITKNFIDDKMIRKMARKYRIKLWQK